MNFLEVDKLVKQIGDVVAVNNISFCQAKLERLAIIGSTGSGKTSLLKMIAGLVQPSSGKMYFNDKKIIGPEEQLIPGNKGIAFVSQHFELLNNYVVKDLLQMTSKLDGLREHQVYSICKIEHVLHRKTNELSGGEKQRVALAKQILTSPSLLLLDEPFSNLDALHKQMMKQVINDLIDTFNLTCILVSHDAADVLQWATRVIVLQHGVIIQDDKTSVVYKQPINEYAAALLGDYFVINTTTIDYLPRNLTKNEKLILRPEQVHITAASVNSNATVTSILYFGSYLLIQLMYQQQTVLCKVEADSNLRIGDTVELYFKF
ncbi:MAG: ABC transporter ATP-binding protein [Chitinophagaceae bacterium]